MLKDLRCLKYKAWATFCITVLCMTTAISYIFVTGPVKRVWADSQRSTPGINEKSSRMRLEGRYTFTVTQSDAGSQVEWSVDRRVDGAVEHNVYNTTGTKASFDLDWIDGNTTYIISAADATFEDEFTVQVFPPDKGIRYVFKNPYRSSPDITIQVQVPSGLNRNTPLISVHHGMSRSNYFAYWTDWGRQQKWIILAPHFPDSGQWANSTGYSLGNMFTRSNGKGELNPIERWSYRIAVDAAVSLLEGFDLKEKTFDIWGHSAGGQFTHRTALFIRDAPIRRCLPANPGWWTLPVYDETDDNYAYPYGIYHPKLDYGPLDIERFLNISGVINAGNRDTERDDNLRTTPQADAQGLNRWLRAQNMYQLIHAHPTNHQWAFFEVDGVGHSGRSMSKAAQRWLVDNPIQSPKAPTNLKVLNSVSQ